MKRENNVKLLVAARRGDLSTVRRLLNKGANVNATDRHGETALIWAAATGNIDLVKFLIDKGADINMADNDGCTAREYAYEQGYTKIAGLLKEKEMKSSGIYLLKSNPIYSQV